MSENKFYKTTDWKGHPNYECLHCPFATLERQIITKHIEKHIAEVNVQAVKEVQREEDNKVADEFLNEVVKDEKVVEDKKKSKKKKGAK